MSVLKVWQNNRCREIAFSAPAKLSTFLAQQGIHTPHPCGGRGVCGNCAIRAEGALSDPSPTEKKHGIRLSCQLQLLGDATVWLPDDNGTVELSVGDAIRVIPMAGRYGAAIDIGTTTIALLLYDLNTGLCLGRTGAMNPQRSIAGDVMGRIGAAMEGNLPSLQAMVTDTIRELLDTACSHAQIVRSDVDMLVVTGNTTMLYLLTGKDPTCLSAAPFLADDLFDRTETLLGIPVYYPPCISAFVGADITCALLDSGLCAGGKTALLCDIGTNGEIALWKDGKLYVTSTAAGPAFEGAGISCGCESRPGAVDRVWLQDGTLHIHTIDDREAAGICGSGLIDAIAAFLATGQIDETGAAEEARLRLTDDVFLIPGDIRAVQLAKGAIAAGIRTLLETAGITGSDVDTLFIAGGFGSHLNPASAAAIGLIPRELEPKVRILGNSALAGAAKLLLDREKIPVAREIARSAATVILSGSSRFSQYFMEAMLFGSDLSD
ncbi:MAG: DUF4445 domain-containing protein [Oscillospiraceae bacterium]|nr:DUF4445 domain-containing protein [Oscillospiraceae bacterium]